LIVVDLKLNAKSLNANSVPAVVIPAVMASLMNVSGFVFTASAVNPAKEKRINPLSHPIDSVICLFTYFFFGQFYFSILHFFCVFPYGGQSALLVHLLSSPLISSFFYLLSGSLSIRVAVFSL